MRMNYQSAASLLDSNDTQEVIQALNFLSAKSFEQTMVDSNNFPNPNNLEYNPRLVLSLGSLLDTVNPLFDQELNEPIKYALLLNKLSTTEWSDDSIKEEIQNKKLEVKVLFV